MSRESSNRVERASEAHESVNNSNEIGPDFKEEHYLPSKQQLPKGQLWKCLKKACVAQLLLTLLLTLILCMICFLIQDVLYNGLGTSNGKYISFADSLSSCASFRSFQPARRRTMISGAFRKIHKDRFRGRAQSLFWIRSKKSSWLISVSVVFLAALAKFGSQSLGSVLLGQTPTIMKGWRHSVSFLVAFLVVQLSPGDFVFTSLSESMAMKTLLKIACAFYKTRKFNFVIDAGAGFSTLFTTAIQLVSIDGNTLFQNIELSVFTQKLSTDYNRVRKQFLEARKCVHVFFIRRSLPLAILTWLSLAVCNSAFSSTCMFPIRFITLLFFLHRHDVHRLLQNVWQERYAYEVRADFLNVACKLSRPFLILRAYLSLSSFDIARLDGDDSGLDESSEYEAVASDKLE